MTSFTTKCITPVLCCLYPGNLRCVKFDSMLSRLSPTKGVPGDPRGSYWRQIPHPASLVITQVKKSLILPSHPYLPTPTTFHFLLCTYLFNPDFSLLPILYEIRKCRSGENKLSNKRSFIIWLSGEGFTSFGINNSTNFFGEKKVKWSVPGRQLLFITRNNLVLILVLVLKSKVLYYSQTEAHWFSDPQKTYKNPRPISTSMKIMDYIVFFTSVFVFFKLTDWTATKLFCDLLETPESRRVLPAGHMSTKPIFSAREHFGTICAKLFT